MFIYYRVILSAFIAAIKFNEEFHEDMEVYSKIGGVKMKELIILEDNFLKGIKYKLYVSEEAFNKAQKSFLKKLDDLY